MKASSARVAGRFLAAKDWGDPSQMISAYRSTLTAFQQELARLQTDVLGKFTTNDPYVSRLIRGPLSFKLAPLVRAGRPLADWIIQTRVIPAGKTKAIELAVRTVESMARVPKDIPGWYEKNAGRLNLLLEAASWPERSGASEAASQVLKVGPFEVHNTIGADDKHFKEIADLVENAVRSLSTTRDFKKVLYGPVFVVGQLKQSKTLAWYSITDDDVYVRSLAKKGRDDLQSLIHELGHRYWFKFASQDQKRAIITLYRSLGFAKVEMPNEGDPLPIPLKGHPTTPTIVKKTVEFHRGRPRVVFQLSTGGYVLASDVEKILSTKAAFPSMYSATNYEEFFAECFSFYTLGQLKPDLASKFEAALSGQPAVSSVGVI